MNNYSTSFLDLCSCALGVLLLLMFLLVPQSKSKNALDSGNKPSIEIKSCFPVYQQQVDSSIHSPLPFSLEEITSVRIGLSNGQFHEFTNKSNANNTGSLWKYSPNPNPKDRIFFLNEYVDECSWWLTITYEPPKSGKEGCVTINADIELPDDNFKKLEVAIWVNGKLKERYTDHKYPAVDTKKIGNEMWFSIRIDDAQIPSKYGYNISNATINKTHDYVINGDFYSNVSIFLKEPCSSGNLDGLYITRNQQMNNGKVEKVKVYFKRFEKNEFEGRAKEIVKLNDPVPNGTTANSSNKNNDKEVSFYSYVSFINEEDKAPSIEKKAGGQECCEFRILDVALNRALDPSQL